MAIIGCSYLRVAKYNYHQVGGVEYTDPAIIAKLVRIRIELENGNDNDFYADNGIDETDNQFAGGKFSMNTNDLTNEASETILGVTSESLETIEGITDEGVKELIFDDDQVSPELGIGVVIKHKRRGETVWTGLIICRAMFQIPAEEAETQGKTISWQTPTLEGTIMRDDSEKHRWKRKATFTTESQAIAYVNARLGGNTGQGSSQQG